MSPILGARGGLAASAYGFTSAVAAVGDYESIASVTLSGGSAATIDFTSIAGTYSHLQIRGIGRNTSTANGLWINFNSDTTSANYYAHYIFGSGASAVAGAGASTPIASYFPISSDTASAFGAAVIDILDYSNTNKYTTVRTLGGYDANGSGYAWFDSTLWKNTAAVTSVTIKMAANNLAQYSSFALYGIK
jgi:hypothetical protein